MAYTAQLDRAAAHAACWLTQYGLHALHMYESQIEIARDVGDYADAERLLGIYDALRSALGAQHMNEEFRECLAALDALHTRLAGYAPA